VKFTFHLNLVPRLSMTEAVLLFSYVPLRRDQRKLLPLHFLPVKRCNSTTLLVSYTQTHCLLNYAVGKLWLHNPQINPLGPFKELPNLLKWVKYRTFRHPYNA